MAAAPRVELIFGPARIEVGASLVEGDEGLQAFARQAEQQFGLSPNTFSFYDSFGKIEKPATLRRAVGAARGGVCQLEIRENFTENTEGKIMREMHSAIKALEDKMTAKIEEAVASVRRDLEPKVKRVVDDHVMLRLKVDGMLDEALAMRTDALAVEDELNKRIDSLAQDCLAMRVDALAGEEELSARLDVLANDCATKELEHLEQELQAELEAQASRDFDFEAASENLEQILVDVRNLEQKQEEEVEGDETEHSAKQEETESTKAPRSPWSMPWDKIVKSSLERVPFSGKASLFDQGMQRAQYGDWLLPHFGAGAPFAHGTDVLSKTTSRFHSEGLRGIRLSRSTPLLAPLQ